MQKHFEGCGKKDIGSKDTSFSLKVIFMVFTLHMIKVLAKNICKRPMLRSHQKSEEPYKLSLKCESDDNCCKRLVPVKPAGDEIVKL